MRREKKEKDRIEEYESSSDDDSMQYFATNCCSNDLMKSFEEYILKHSPD